jgi:signal transduction histidine kinase
MKSAAKTPHRHDKSRSSNKLKLFINGKLLKYLPYLGVILVLTMVFETQRAIQKSDQTLDRSMRHQEDLRRLIWANLLMQRSTGLATAGFLSHDPSYFERARTISDSIPIGEKQQLTTITETDQETQNTLNGIFLNLTQFQTVLRDIKESDYSTGKPVKNLAADKLLSLSENIGQNLVQVETSQWYEMQDHNLKLLQEIKNGHAHLMFLYLIFLPFLILLSWILGRKNRAEKALKESQFSLQMKTVTLQKAQALARLGTWTYRLSNGESNWSTEVSDMLGLPAGSESLGYEVFKNQIHLDDRPLFEGSIKSCLEQERPVEIEFRLLAIDGTIRHCSFLCQPYGNTKEDHKDKVLCILQDITSQKIAEGLRLERDAAEKSNKTKSIFLANISHELRTPMHGILSFARFGQQKIETASKEKLKTYFDEIHDSASRLMNLLNDLLDLAKHESGKIVYDMGSADLLAVTKAVINEMHATIDERGLKIALSCKIDAVYGIFDSERIMQVVRNLLSNALKFSYPGSTIRVLISESSDQMMCEVINNGVGIPPLELESVFDKFIQSSKTSTGAGGTGLGLAICKEIVQHHGGKIWVNSQMDAETKFCFEISKTIKADSQTSRAS